MRTGVAFGRLRSPTVAIPLAVLVALLTVTGAPVAQETGYMLGITAFCIALWILTPIPPSYTGVICIGLVGIVFSSELALTGFQSPATWLIGFGLLMSEATKRSGLASWVGEWVVTRGVPERSRADPIEAFGFLLLSLCIGALALAVLVPSTLVRVLILAPILQKTGAMFESRKAQAGIFLAPLFATFYGSAGIFTAGLQNIIIVGITESILGQTISWFEWTAVMFPVTGLVRAGVIAGVLYVIYKPAADTTVDLPATEPTALPSAARRMALFLVVGVGIWTTDFIHGLHPMYGAVVVVVLSFLPTVGVVEYGDAVGEVDYSILFFVGGVFAIGEGLARTGFTDSVAGSMLTVLSSDSSLLVVLAFVFVSTILLALLMEGLAVASVITPVFVSFATEANIPIEPVMMTEAFALTTYFFPFQSVVLVAMLAEGVVDTPELIRITAILSVVSIPLLLLQFLIFLAIY
ncbi:MAG: SLC13 family permease [Halobacteriota archaeon]